MAKLADLEAHRDTVLNSNAIVDGMNTDTKRLDGIINFLATNGYKGWVATEVIVAAVIVAKLPPRA